MAGWAFTVTRCGSREDVGLPMHEPSPPPPPGDHKGTQPNHPTTLAPTESSIEAWVDANYRGFNDYCHPERQRRISVPSV